MQKLNKAELKQIVLPVVKLNKPKSGYQLHAEQRQLQTEEILVLDAYKGQQKNPEYRIFIGKEDYISLNLLELRKTGKYKWKSNLTFNLLNYSYYRRNWQEDEEWINKADEETARMFFHTNGSAINNLRTHEERINVTRLDEKDKKILDQVDIAMDKILELPKDFATWVREEAFYDYRYLFYKYSRKKETEGFCAFCGETVRIENPKHNERGECPHCKSKVILKAAGKTKYVNVWRMAALIQPYEKGFVVRRFDIHLRGTREEKTTVTCFETQRCIYPKGNEFRKEVYTYGSWKQRKNRWLPPSEDASNVNVHLYHKNLKELMEGTIYQYSAIEQLAAEPGMSFGLHGFISQYPANRYYEYFIKSGLIYVVRDLSLITYYNNFRKGINMNGKSAAEILGIQKYDIPELIKAKAGTTGLRYIKECRKRKIKLVPEQIAFVDQYFHQNEQDFVKLLDYTTPHKAIRFLKGERGAVIRRYKLWIDYIDICKKLKYDMKNTFLLFPKNLKRAHDEATEEYNSKKDEKRKKEENKRYKKIRQMQKVLNDKYYMEWNDLIIRAPKDAGEIIAEGHVLHHCVAGYTRRVAAGETVILFLRKKEKADSPYFTVEVRDNKVVQYHGKYNDAQTPIPKEVHQFIKKFKAEKLKKKVKEQIMVAS